jgi:hypothetical protein
MKKWSPGNTIRWWTSPTKWSCGRREGQESGEGGENEAHLPAKLVQCSLIATTNDPSEVHRRGLCLEEHPGLRVEDIWEWGGVSSLHDGDSQTFNKWTDDPADPGGVEVRRDIAVNRQKQVCEFLERVVTRGTLVSHRVTQTRTRDASDGNEVSDDGLVSLQQIRRALVSEIGAKRIAQEDQGRGAGGDRPLVQFLRKSGGEESDRRYTDLADVFHNLKKRGEGRRTVSLESPWELDDEHLTTVFGGEEQGEAIPLERVLSGRAKDDILQPSEGQQLF